jgi:hypothetical protein
MFRSVSKKYGMSPPKEVHQSEGFWAVLLSGVLLGFLDYAVVGFQSRKKE